LIGAGIHRQHALHAARVCEVAAEVAEQVVVEGATGQRELADLPRRGLDESRVAVAEVQRRVRREAVEVGVVLGVVDPDAVAARDDDGQRVVGVCAVAVLQIDRTRGGCLVLHEIHLG
jgi:hypothetical protein